MFSACCVRKVGVSLCFSAKFFPLSVDEACEYASQVLLGAVGCRESADHHAGAGTSSSYRDSRSPAAAQVFLNWLPLEMKLENYMRPLFSAVGARGSEWCTGAINQGRDVMGCMPVAKSSGR